MEYLFNGTGHESMIELNLGKFKLKSIASDNAPIRINDIFIDCGSEGVLERVVVSSDAIKEIILSYDSMFVPHYFKKKIVVGG